MMITTRQATDADLPTVLTMVHALAAHHGDPPTLTLRDLQRDVTGPVPWITLIVAQGAADLVGYAALCPRVQLQTGRRGMDMHHLFVAAKERGQGVGRKLIEASILLAKVRGCSGLTVGTHPDNAHAAGVYRSAGFAEVNTIGSRFVMRW